MSKTSLIPPLVVLVVAALPAAAVAQTELTCLLTPKVVVALASPVEGILSEVSVDRGDHVTSGQVVAQLDSRVQHATLDRAEAHAAADAVVAQKQADLEQNQAKLTRAQGLADRAVISDQALDDQQYATRIAEQALRAAQQDLADAELEAKIAQAELDLTQVVSPVDGVVIQRLASPGRYSSVQTPILRIAQLDPLYVEISLPVEAFGTIATGMRAQLKITPGNIDAVATVIVVDPVVDAASRTFGVRLSLANPDGRVPSGLRCQVVAWLPAA